MISAPYRTSKNLLQKSRTGRRGFDEITLGGLPTGRPMLVSGGAGCGKMLFGIEFLVPGAIQFEESPKSFRSHSGVSLVVCQTKKK
jgi:circadian clock protein KaiC